MVRTETVIIINDYSLQYEKCVQYCQLQCVRSGCKNFSWFILIEYLFFNTIIGAVTHMTFGKTHVMCWLWGCLSIKIHTHAKTNYILVS